jgi:hypothetical protein
MIIGAPKMPKPTAVQLEDVGQETPLSPATAGGVDWRLQVRPALTLERFESHPATLHAPVIGHAAEVSWPMPLGEVAAAQFDPPSSVVVIVEPDPDVPLLPTATQSLAVEHETPVRSTADPGREAADQVAPLSVDVAPKGVESELVPTAKQRDSDGQTTALNCFPVAELGCVQVPPPFDVLTSIAPVVVPSPTTKQWEPSEHDTPNREVTKGWSDKDQLFPSV